MFIIIPLGGLGERFKKHNYYLPKPLINVKGKPIICWLLDSLHIRKDMTICIPYNKVLKDFRFESLLIKDYPHIKFIFKCLEYDTRGAVESLKHILDELHEHKCSDSHVLCLDGDNFYNIDIISRWNKGNQVFIYEDNTDRECFSFVKTIAHDVILEIEEKTRISDFACTGAYGFESFNILREMCNHVIDNNITNMNEYYTSGLINEMIKKSHHFTTNVVNKNDWICLGTPIDLQLFYENYRDLYKFKKRYCFDLDNTLVTFPTIPDDYTSVNPIEKNIDVLRKIHSQGNTIIINTSRRMKTHHDNVGKVIADIGKLTIDTLEKFEIPYDELYFGKPLADFYIDDLAISSFSDVHKELGFYNTNVMIRDFNSIKPSTTIEVYRKSSHDLSSEIYYYRNIPNEVRDLFPVFIRHDKNNKWYDIERINGLTVSKMFLSNQLNESHLKTIIQKIHSLHSVELTACSHVNIYENYAKKLKHRFDTFDYSFLPNYLETYESILTKLISYEKNVKGTLGVIHGDCVFTNIIFDNEHNIKFIDMRGEVGNIKTIYGDVMYDWAKLYQSLIGYDEIQEGIVLDKTYKSCLLNTFENSLKNILKNDDWLDSIKVITKSLLFSLIPLHYSKDNIVKCKLYYDLIHNI